MCVGWGRGGKVVEYEFAGDHKLFSTFFVSFKEILVKRRYFSAKKHYVPLMDNQSIISLWSRKQIQRI